MPQGFSLRKEYDWEAKMPTIRQFFGFEEDPRTPEGWFSWQHLTYVTALVIAVILLGTTVGRHFHGLSFAQRRKPLRVAAILMLALEAFKIILISIRSGDPWSFRSMLPLFLCSIILFTLPIAAFGRGRLAAAAMNFTFVFGMLCCLAGTYLAANYYDHSPVFSFDPIISSMTHAISGFSAVYIGVSGLAKRQKGDLGVMAAMLGIFEAMALAADLIQLDSAYECNYMFFMRPDGTPFSICMNLVGGNQALYTLFVAALYFAYLFLFLLAWRCLTRRKPEA